MNNRNCEIDESLAVHIIIYLKCTLPIEVNIIMMMIATTVIAVNIAIATV